MIQILDKQHCCGCAACVQRCPKHCISVQEDAEGFLYPKVDLSRCIDCGLCEKVCPELHAASARKPLATYAGKHKNDEIREGSSSGGVFTALAEKVIEAGGVVFGARFDANWETMHDYTETIAGLSAFRGSKYMQSRIGNSYTLAEQFLKSGRTVLFTGTPCQIAGLKLFLRKDYDQLLTVDVICHGAPSPGVWRQYLQEEIARQRNRKNANLPSPISGSDVRVVDIAFRNKVPGWKKYSFALTLSATGKNGKDFSFCSRIPFTENLFMQGFLADLYLRPSCYACPAKGGQSNSDLTLGDFWGIQHVMPQLDDDKGISVVLVNTEKGQTLLDQTKINVWPTDYLQVLPYNPALERSAQKPLKRERFYASGNNIPISKRIVKCTRSSYKQRLNQHLRKSVSAVLGKKGKMLIKKWVRKCVSLY